MPLSRGIVGGIVLAALALVTAYVILASTAGAGPSRANPVYALPSVTQTPLQATPSAPAATPAVSSSVPSSVPPLGGQPPTAPSSAGTTAADTALQRWYDSSGHPLMHELEALVDQIQADINTRDLDGLGEDCTALGDLSDEARSARPPGTETQIAADWDDAADLAAAAAGDCLTAIESDDEQLLRSALEQARLALVYAHRAIAAVEEAI